MSVAKNETDNHVSLRPANKVDGTCSQRLKAKNDVEITIATSSNGSIKKKRKNKKKKKKTKRKLDAHSTAGKNDSSLYVKKDDAASFLNAFDVGLDKKRKRLQEQSLEAKRIREAARAKREQMVNLTFVITS